MKRVLVDTDVLIDLGRGEAAAMRTHKVLAAKRILAISTITKMELLVGCANKREQQRLEKFLQGFDLIHPEAGISEAAVELVKDYRLSHNLRMPDALIAATALHCECELATKNQKDYRFLPDLQLLPYPVVKL